MKTRRCREASSFSVALGSSLECTSSIWDLVVAIVVSEEGTSMLKRFPLERRIVRESDVIFDVAVFLKWRKVCSIVFCGYVLLGSDSNFCL